MKKLLFTLAIAVSLLLVMAFAVCAAEITVVDDGTTEITLGDCVIEGLDREIPEPSSGFTYVLNTETKTAKITKWAYNGDAENGVNFVIPSTVTYNGETYTVTSFNRVTSSNKILVLIAIPDTVTAIPNSAFDSCGAVRYIYVGSGVETIGSSSFQWVGFAGSKTLVDENGEKVGDIRDFIWKTQKITKLSSSCFLHLDFNPDCVIEFPFDKITTYESSCMAYNPYALTADHDIGRQLYLDVFDLRNATSIANDAFTNAALAKTIIVSAEQTNVLSPQKLRGGGTSQPDKYCDFIIYGGETAETAVTLTGGVWTANAHYWYPGDVHFSIVFRGYVNAYDGTDGLENQNGYGNDLVDYFFESEDAFNHYIESVKTTTNAATTFARYAKNSKGYFNVCTVVDGVHSFKAYNLKYTAATETDAAVVEISEYTQTSFKYGYPTYDIILDDDCTASNLCRICDFMFSKGIEHVMGEADLLYPNGYTNVGVERIACTNEGCTLCNDTEIPALFTSKGYSKDTTSNAIVLNILANNEAISAYEAYLIRVNGDASIVYGIAVAIADKDDDTSNDVLFDENGAVLSGVVAMRFENNDYSNIQTKITGIGENNYETALHCSGYVNIDGTVTYINGPSTASYASKVTYASLPDEEN